MHPVSAAYYSPRDDDSAPGSPMLPFSPLSLQSQTIKTKTQKFMRIYTLYSAVGTTTNAACNVSIVSSGRIKQIIVCAFGVLNADGERYQLEVGAVPTIQGTTHDSVGSIAFVQEGCGILTTGGQNGGINSVIPCDYAVASGDKIYLHWVLSGTNDCRATVLLYVN
jgi:hypothetical protein